MQLQKELICYKEHFSLNENKVYSLMSENTKNCLLIETYKVQINAVIKSKRELEIKASDRFHINCLHKAFYTTFYSNFKI